MTNQELLQRNYASTVKRGLIKPETNKDEFISKMNEEFIEFIFADMVEEPYELADIILVCMSYATHYNIDIFKYLEKKIEINENR